MQKRHLKRLVWAAALLLSCSLCLFILTDRQCELVITRTEDGREWSFPLYDRRFSLYFTHSVMKTPVEEIYIVDSGELLVLVETHYESYGVGLPFLPEEGDLVTENGRFVLKLRREVGTLSMVISPLAEHGLRIGDRVIPLSSLIGDGSARVSVTARERMVWVWEKGL